MLSKSPILIQRKQSFRMLCIFAQKIYDFLGICIRKLLELFTLCPNMAPQILKSVTKLYVGKYEKRGS